MRRMGTTLALIWYLHSVCQGLSAMDWSRTVPHWSLNHVVPIRTYRPCVAICT